MTAAAVELTVAGDALAATLTRYDPALVDALKACPDGRRFDRPNKRWLIPPTPWNVAHLRRLPLDADPAAAALMNAPEERATRAAELTRLRADPAAACPDFPFVTEPYDHQRVALAWCLALDSVALLMEMGCVDGETEYLSPGGWVRMDEYNGGNVAQWDPESMRIEFVEPLRYIEKPCDEPMVRIKTKYGLDQMLSQDHEVAVLTYPLGVVKKIKAADVYRKHVEHKTGFRQRIPTGFQYRGGDGLRYSEAELRLIVAIIADGHFASKHTRRVYVRLKKRHKIERMRAMLGLTGIEYDERKVKPEGFRCFVFEAPDRLKHFPSSWWTGTSDHQRDIICDEVLRWDGDGRARFFSRDKRSADFVQFCFASRGRGARLLRQVRESGVDYVVHVRQKHGTDLHVNGKTASGEKLEGNVWLEDAPRGMQYCFTVPSGYLLLRRNGCIFATGNCGKTKVVIDAIRYRLWKGQANRVLIVSPLSVVWNWVDREFPKHARFGPGQVQSLAALPKAERVARIMREGPLVDVINVDGLRTTERELLTRGYDMVIVDESTRIKNHTSKRAKAAFRLGDQAKYRIIMTGTPVTQTPMDLFAQWRFLDGGATFGVNYYSFRARWCRETRPYPGAPFTNWVPHEDAPERLGERIAINSVSYRKADCLDLPEKVFTRREVALSSEQRDCYDELVGEALTELDGEEYRAEFAMTRITKLAQVASGFLQREDIAADGSSSRTVRRFKQNPKLDLLAELVEEALPAGPVVVWAHFRESVRMLLERLMQYNPASAYGETRDLRAELARFQNDPSCRVIVANPASVGLGCDFSHAPTALYYERGWSAENRWQSLDRNHRPGAEHHERILYVDLLALGTVEADVLEALEEHEDVASRVMSRGAFEAMLQQRR